jgi:polysaccharide biosynthesis protein PslH
MNILFLATWFPYPSDNGSKLRVYHLLRALGKANAVTLLSFAFDTAQPAAPDGLTNWCRQIQVVTLNPFAANQAGPLRTFMSARPVASRPIPAMRSAVAAALCARAFDAVIASTEMTADYVLQAPPGTVKILEEHNAMTRWMHERYASAAGPVQRARCWASWQKRRRYEARAYRRFDLVTMVSEADRTATLAATGAQGPRVEVVPNGVDCRRNRPGLAQPQPLALVYNGALTYSANYDAMRWFLAAIYPRIRAQLPEVSLTITGATHGVDLGGLALDESVRLTGFVEDVRLPVAEASVCVTPIRQGGGTRLKILEAMALGTPVVATRKAAEGLAVVDGEHLLLADDPQRFADQTVTMLRDAALRARLAANARRLVESRYDWEQIGRRFVELVKTTVENRAKVRTLERL